MEASYEPVPASWYAAIGLSMLAAAIYVVTFYPMQLPVWGLLLSLLVALVFLPACGIIAATTGTVIGKSRLCLSQKEMEANLCDRPQRNHRIHRWFSASWSSHRKYGFQVLWIYGVRKALQCKDSMG